VRQGRDLSAFAHYSFPNPAAISSLRASTGTRAGIGASAYADMTSEAACEEMTITRSLEE
jgi:hypothetical protein